LLRVIKLWSDSITAMCNLIVQNNNEHYEEIIVNSDDNNWRKIGLYLKLKNDIFYGLSN